uniref:Olfactory receptor n=1 Tax=Pyxicephalus adspersus TaxID=30357 RepID=A0AAV3AE73_PYXAD|nr:TPA: hypothetical protein GDO54_009912 [Pyxicephalus adspersus]
MDLNRTYVTEVIFLGFSANPEINIVLFLLFFVIYLTTFIGNTLIICLVILYHQLHTPMYYFLCILSFVDLCNSSTVVPRLLIDLFSVRRSIPLGACAVQLYIVLLMGGTECLLLAIMAYDRYVAISHPLHYLILMRWEVCYRLTAFLWITSFFVFVFPSLLSPLTLCNPNQINHFMCEVIAIMTLSCYQANANVILILVICFINILLPFVFILGTYIGILCSVLKIHSTQRSKALSTCTSHITVVVLFYGSALVMNFGAMSPYSKNQGKYITVFYLIICPMLNPIIYSLNNTEVKNKLRYINKKKLLVCN